MEVSEEQAEKYFVLGNYKSSGILYRNLIKKSKNSEDRSDFEYFLSECDEYYENVKNIVIGEAFFPVYDEASKNSAILTLRITDNPSGPKTFNIDNVKTAVIKFLDDYLFKEIKTIMVLDWKIENLKAEVKNIPNENNEFKKFVKSIEGRSYELAAAAALISYIIKIKVSPKFVFSGAIDVDTDNVKLTPVDKIKEKLECIKKERPGVKKFVIPYSSGIENDKIIVGYENLSECITKMFKDFKMNIENALLNNSNIKKISLKINGSELRNKTKVKVFNFNHDEIREIETLKVFEFLSNISDKLTGKKEGIILDGLKASFLTPMLVSSNKVSNHIANFVAVRSGYGDNDYPKAVVVRTSNTSNRNFKVGNIIEYKSTG